MKIVGSICLKHPELKGERRAVHLDTGGLTPGNCIACSVSASREWKTANPAQMKVLQAAWQAKNRPKINAWIAKWKRKNKERVVAVGVSYRKTHAELLAKKANDWRIKNKGRVLIAARSNYKKNIEKRRDDARRWAKKHRERCAVRENARRAARISATPAWANKFFMEEAYHLAALRTKMLGYPWHVDHIVPLKSPLVCGLHVENNLQVIPAAQNMAKGNRYWPNMPQAASGNTFHVAGWYEIG